jgi:membrane protease YdiL (CAAX protease family)
MMRDPSWSAETPIQVPPAPTSGRDDAFSAELRGFGPLGIFAMVAIVLTGNVFVGPMIVVPVGALLVLVWVVVSRTPWSAIGYVRPKSWMLTFATGLAFGIAFKLLMKTIVMPLLGAPPINQSYHFLAGNRALLPAATWAMINAGFAEETVFRGYLFERLGRLFGSSVGAKTAIVLITATAFGFAHYSTQGIPGVEQSTIVGLLFGTVAATTGSIIMLMIAHATFDLTALAMIYSNTEPTFAHLIFR